MPIAPAIVDDGNFKTPTQNGAISFAYPFAESRNDFDTFVATRVMRVDTDYWRKPIAMSQKSFGSRGTGYLVGVSEPQPVDGTSLIEYVERYAPIPKRQVVPGSASASIQQIINLEPDISKPPKWYPVPISDIFDAEYHYDYFLGSRPLERLTRSRLVIYPFAVGEALQFGIGIKSPPPGGLYLAQNSITSVWMGGILCRESIYVIPPPIQKWRGF